MQYMSTNKVDSFKWGNTIYELCDAGIIYKYLIL